MLGKYNRSVILTYIGVGCSLVGIFFVMAGSLTPAILCLVLAGICDLFDGVIARRCERTDEEKAFGMQIDSLADVVSFLAFPAVLSYVLCEPLGWIAAVTAGLYILAGIIRLAWFNIHADKEHPVAWFEGLPVTYASLVISAFYVAFTLLKAELPVIWCILFLGMAVLFILRIKIPKPAGKWYLILSLLAVVLIVLLLLIQMKVL